MADNQHLTLSEPIFQAEQEGDDSISTVGQLHRAAGYSDQERQNQEISDVQDHMSVSAEQVVDRIQVNKNTTVKRIAKTKPLLPTNVFHRVIVFLVYFGFIIPMLIFISKVFFGVKYEGKKKIRELSKKQRGFVVTCNHMHPMDCTWMGTLVSPRKMIYTSMEKNFNIPVVGPSLRFFGCVPINKTIDGLRNFMSEMTDAVKKGRVVGVYPEGGIELYCDHLRKFSDGAFAIAVDADAPVLPVVITPRERKGLWKLLKRNCCITITVGTAIYPQDCGTHRKTVHRLRDDVEAEMNYLLNIGGKAYPKK